MTERATRRTTARSGPTRAVALRPRITVLLVEDHAVVREGIRLLLESEGDIAVVGEAQDGRQAVTMAAELRPDVVLMDIGLPNLNGIEATRQILGSAPATRVILLSAHADDEYVQRVSELGASGYVLKQSSLETLAEAIRAARPDRFFVGPSIRPRPAPAAPDAPPGQGRRRPAGPRPLTVRESEVLQMIAEGRANKQTAITLGISIKTVEKHRQSLMTKLDIHDVAGLTRYAIAHGTIEGRDRPVPE